MPRAVALFSGGLDSMLAVRILQEQGFEVEALNIRTPFECCKTPATQAAVDLGIRMTVVSVKDDYLELIRRPVYGYGKGVNPCIDCRIYLTKMGKRFMEQADACVVVTGEVAGQRPMSQKRWQLDLIAKHSGLEGRLLRPLSAKLLKPTEPELEGLIDRDKLFDFHGRSRTGLIELAGRFGIHEIPQPSTGCALTETSFAPRVMDLMDHSAAASRWDFELLSTGRHVRVDAESKVVVGRNEKENGMIESFFDREDASESALLVPEDFLGPSVLLIGKVTDRALEITAGLLLRYTRRYDPQDGQIRVAHQGRSRVLRTGSLQPAEVVNTL
jgi:tRNA-uridine 2-sulfurtransferase